MPPAQCPECARFLSNAFVTGLRAAPAPCPKCGTTLTPDQFDLDDGAADVPSSSTATPATSASAQAPDDAEPAGPAASDAAAEAAVAASVRPPDLAADAVGGADRDPLAGWDRPDDVTATLPPGPDRATRVGTAAGGGAAAGALLGAWVARRRVRGALLGAVVGALAGVAGAEVVGRGRP